MCHSGGDVLRLLIAATSGLGRVYKMRQAKICHNKLGQLLDCQRSDSVIYSTGAKISTYYFSYWYPYGTCIHCVSGLISWAPSLTELSQVTRINALLWLAISNDLNFQLLWRTVAGPFKTNSDCGSPVLSVQVFSKSESDIRLGQCYYLLPSKWPK